MLPSDYWRRNMFVEFMEGDLGVQLRDIIGVDNISGGMISRMLNRPGRCPRHYACFDVRTGRLLNGPVSVDVPIYEVRIEGDTVFVKGGTD